MLGPPFFGQLALDGGFQHGGTIAFQIRPDPSQGRNSSVKVGEKFLDLGDDAALLVERREREVNLGQRGAG